MVTPLKEYLRTTSDDLTDQYDYLDEIREQMSLASACYKVEIPAKDLQKICGLLRALIRKIEPMIEAIE